MMMNSPNREELAQAEAAHRAQASGAGARARLEVADELRLEIAQLAELQERRQEVKVRGDRLIAQLRLAVLAPGAREAMLDSAGMQSARSNLDRATAEIQHDAAAVMELWELLR